MLKINSSHQGDLLVTFSTPYKKQLMSIKFLSYKNCKNFADKKKMIPEKLKYDVNSELFSSRQAYSSKFKV